MKKKTAAIFGAGPVGLLLCYKLLLLNYRVDVYEIRSKNNFTSRKQVLFLKPKQYKRLVPRIKRELKQRICAHATTPEFFAEMNCFFHNYGRKYNFSAEIGELQKAIYNAVLKSKKDVHFHFNTAADENLAKRLLKADTKLIISTSGATSSIVDSLIKSRRKNLCFKKKSCNGFGGTLIGPYYIARTKGVKKARPKRQDVVRIFPSRKQRLYIGFLMSKKEYEQIKKKKVLQPKVKTRILKKTKEFGIKKINFNRMKMSIFPITMFSKSKVIARVDNSIVANVGDAAYPAHYFTYSGVNNGFEEVYELMRYKLKDVSTRALTRRYQTYIDKASKKYMDKVIQIYSE